MHRLRHFVLPPGHNLSCKPFPPRPEQCIVFYPRGFEVTEQLYTGTRVHRPRSVVCGQFTQRINRYVGGPEFLMIEVDLQPGVLHRLTGVPFKELANKNIDAEAFFGAELRRVNERLGSADSYTEMIALVEAFFHHLVQRQRGDFIAVDGVLRTMAHDPDSLTVDDLARGAYLSQRQLERRFDERVGISPKTFLRICRFNQSYWMHLKHPHLDWLHIALACGYHDYQHLVRDYKDFAAATPKSFFSEERNAPGRVLGLTK